MEKNNYTIELKHSSQAINYEYAVQFMQKRVDLILTKCEKELIWFLDHNHIYTQGATSKDNEIIKKINVPILKANRGGKTTYHGPGQRVVYLMIDLNKRKKDIRRFISLIENTIINLLSSYKIESTTFRDRVGVWVIKNQGQTLKKEMKIAAIGLRIKKWVTYHGLSFNIKPELKYYEYIKACGLSNYQNTSLKQLGINVSSETFDKDYLKEFSKNLQNFN
ncbi:MAG: hypothetical protein CMI96_02885 [Pelagibacteraceae bacterium]|nr:hypothetical protein [Pelagibacteraceae bacterium]|tara:strand:- start:79037 stop:79699 length:663 start_codon:yes stop_codon:yes gene_type:complete